MKLRLEIRYGVLISFLLLLWQIGEYEIGLHDKFISYHATLTLFGTFIPIVCGWFALKEKTQQLNGSMNFQQAFIAGVLISLFAALCSIPLLSVFYKFINPEYFRNMIEYSVQRATNIGIDAVKVEQEAEMYFNFYAFILQGFLGTVFFGTLLALIMAWRMRTVK